MSACKLQGQVCGCAQHFLSSRSWSFLPKPSQTLRRHTSTFALATASATNGLTLEPKAASLHPAPLVLGRWPVTDEASGHVFASPSVNVANSAVTLLLRNSQAAAVQQLSAEISQLVTELDTELSTFLASTSPLSTLPSQRPHQLQQPQSPSQSISQHLVSSTKPQLTEDPLRQLAGSSGGGTYGSVFDPLTARTAPPAPPAAAAGPTGLPLLSLPAAGSPEAAGAAIVVGGAEGAGSRAERRRQKWRRAPVAAAASAAPPHEAKFKTQGSGSMTILMGSFSKDHILSADEEQLLAAAAQDFMQLNELSRMLTGVLKRPPSVAEMARTLTCDEGALRLRLDSGSRARTLLAQKNYRLVVSIAKRMMRMAGGGGGGGGGAGGGGGGGGAPLGDGGASLDDAITVGMEALMLAIRKFKPEAGYRLSTYATWWIRLHVSRLVHAQAGVITMSVYQRTTVDRFRAARARLRSQLPPGMMPTPEAIAEAAGLTPGQMAQAAVMERTFAGAARSFEAPLADGEKGLSVEDLVAQDEDAELSEGTGSSLFLDSEDFAASASLASTVDGLLASLDRGESELLRKQYGLGPAAGAQGTAGGAEGGLEGVEAAVAAAAAVAASAAAAAAAAAANAAVKPGAERLKLGRKGRLSAAKALEKLRLTTADDPRLAEWLGLRSSKTSYAPRTSGYARKSKG